MRKQTGIRRNTGRIGDAIAVALVVALVTLPMFLSGCSEDCQPPVTVDNPPVPPNGFVSITGDAQVELQWNPNRESDLAGYDLYWSDAEDGDFEYMVSVDRNKSFYVDADVDTGLTYFYKIRAYDRAGNQSGWGTSVFGTNFVFDTPRPAGDGLILHSYTGQDPGTSGYDFSEFRRQAWSVSTTDVYYGPASGVPTLFGKGLEIGTGVDVQDYGFIDLDFVDWAPDIYDGWSPSKRVELIPGHSYVVQIEDGDFYQYAKVYVVSVESDLVNLDWAYQEAEGNPELAPGVGGAR
jgi:catechol 2,3-dioxygenase-like lactoylglutathione lyase family enzyme